MSLYKTFTVREWLTLSTAEDVYEILKKALKDNDEPMAVLAVTDLIKRGDIDLAKKAIDKSFGAGRLMPGSHFVTVLVNALRIYGDRNPEIKRIAEAIEGRTSVSDYIKERIRGERRGYVVNNEGNPMPPEEEPQYIQPHSDR